MHQPHAKSPWVGRGACLCSPEEYFRECAARVPGARVEIVPSLGHLLCMEGPKATADLILDWLNGAEDRPDASAAYVGSPKL